MAISWNTEQRDRVEQVLEQYPAASAQCESAAWEIHPIGLERDPASQVWALFPSEGRYVVPKLKLERPWFHHFTVKVEAHLVDALTGADGTPHSSYLEQHWTETDALRWEQKEDRPNDPW